MVSLDGSWRQVGVYRYVPVGAGLLQDVTRYYKVLQGWVEMIN